MWAAAGDTPEVQTIIISRLFRPVTRIVRLRRNAPRRPLTFGVGYVVAGFALLIAAGTALLSLPDARAPGAGWDFLTALFTAASAVCVTGLVVVDTGTHWSAFGQGVILGLIQIGGFGIMTAAMFILIIFGRPVSLADRFAIRETAGLPRVRTVSHLIVATIIITLSLEAIGGGILYLASADAFPLAQEAFWKSAFTAVSAFNNAGFDNLGSFDSVARFARAPLVLMTVAGLAIMGGLGPIIMLDLWGKRSFQRLSLQSKVVILATLGFLTYGFLGILGAEINNGATLGALPLQDKLANAFFQAVNPRTAGFATFPMDAASDPTRVLIMSLMFVGGATGGTAGGIKVGTFAILALATLAAVRGHDSLRAFGREIGHPIVYRALGVAATYATFIFAGVFLLSITESEQTAFRAILFEAVSAVGTVGLTTGITPDLSPAGKVVIIGLMFVGRVGPLAMVYFFARSAREPRYRMPEGRIGIG